MTAPTYFTTAFERFFDEMRRASYRLPDAGQSRVSRFIRETRPAVIAAVFESEMLEGDVSKDLLTDASKVVRTVEGMGGSAQRKIRVLAIALIVMSDPEFEKRVNRRREQKGNGR